MSDVHVFWCRIAPIRAPSQARLRASLGPADLLTRVRILTPLGDSAYRALLKSAVAVLDPFPVGLHLPLLEALLDGVPVVSAPALQECTNSHAVGIAAALGLGGKEGLGVPQPSAAAEWDTEHLIEAEWGDLPPDPAQEGSDGHGSGDGQSHRQAGAHTGGGRYSWPTTAEEYAVFALRLQMEADLRAAFRRPPSRNDTALAAEPQHGDQLFDFLDRLID